VESVTAAEEARIREACAEDLVGACTEELLAQPDSAPSEEAAKEWWPNPGEDPLGEFTHVTVSYRGVPAVVDVSFPVPHGAIVALIGPSGSGKSSLIRCMNRLNDLVPGAEVDGKVLYRAADLYAPRRRRGRGAQAHRHGVPAAEPVSEDRLRQRRLRPTSTRD
jgi:ABC-type multidrug transport system fused ATPase/permease subunit